MSDLKIVLALDQMSAYLPATLTRVWSPVGQTPVTWVTPQRDHIHFYGALNALNEQDVALSLPRLDGDNTIHFLEHVASCFPGQAILLLANENQANPAWADRRIAEALGINRRTVERIRQTCVEEGIEAALNHKQPRRTRCKVLDGEAEAWLMIEIGAQPVAGGWRVDIQFA